MENKKFWGKFLDAYRELPALWQIKSNEYNNRVLKASAYEVLIQKLKEMYPDADREMVVKKINTLRTTYRKEFKKVKDSEESGAGVYEPNLWYYRKLSFLNTQDDAPKKRSTSEKYGNKGAKKKVRTIEEKSRPQRKRRRSIDDNIEMDVYDTLESSKHANCEADALAESWAVQYDEIQGNQKFIARKIISDVMFHGCMGTLEMSHATVIQQTLLRQSPRVYTSSTPSSSPTLTNTDNYEYISDENSIPDTPPILFVSIPLSSDSISETSSPVTHHRTTIK